MCVCYFPSLCAVFLNHEVVEFQPRIVTAPDLGSGANAYNYSTPPAPPVPKVVSVFVYPPLPPSGPISYFLLHLAPVNSASLSLFVPASPNPMLPWCGATVHLDDASACRSPPLVCASLPPMPTFRRSSSPCLYIFTGAIIWMMLHFLTADNSPEFQWNVDTYGGRIYKYLLHLCFWLICCFIDIHDGQSKSRVS